jgi:hypothetical protein
VKQYVAFLYLTRSTCFYPPILLRFKTWHLLLTVLLLAVVPLRKSRSVVMLLLRIYGRWLCFRRQDLRQLAAFSGSSTFVRTDPQPHCN